MGWMITGILGAIAYRIRGGLGNEFVRRMLGKRAEWEIPNTIICGVWGVFVSLLFPLSWATPLLALIVGATAKIGYLKQIAHYFNFPSGFDLAKKENRTWKNYSLLSARGMLICLPAYILLHSLYPQLLGGVLAGVLMPICYIIGFTIPEIMGKISQSQYGEILIGATVTWGILCW
jgi:amino acid permease